MDKLPSSPTFRTPWKSSRYPDQRLVELSLQPDEWYLTDSTIRRACSDISAPAFLGAWDYLGVWEKAGALLRGLGILDYLGVWEFWIIEVFGNRRLSDERVDETRAVVPHHRSDDIRGHSPRLRTHRVRERVDVCQQMC